MEGFFTTQKEGVCMTVEISILVGVVGLFIAIFGYVLNRDREKKSDATSEAEMKVTLAHISKGVDDIKVDMRSTKEQMNNFSRDLVRVDEATKAAHRRIDKLEGINREN